nr:Uncharacterised protein [Klebsiella pneumoniae]
MSIIKRHMEDQQDKFNVATNIAIEAGVLERCEYCEATVFKVMRTLKKPISLVTLNLVKANLKVSLNLEER